MIVIGLTGSVGTGKTQISKYFVRNGIPVFESDKEVRKIQENETTQKEICKLFPNAIIGRKINRKKLAEIVFKDEIKLRSLEKIVYKKLKIIQEKWIKNQTKFRRKLVVFDVPLLFEKDDIRKYDLKILLTCSRRVQKFRVIKRKDWNQERFEFTVNKQMDFLSKKALADIIINTDRGKRDTLYKVRLIIQNLNYSNHRPIYEILKRFK